MTAPLPPGHAVASMGSISPGPPGHVYQTGPCWYACEVPGRVPDVHCAWHTECEKCRVLAAEWLAVKPVEMAWLAAHLGLVVA